jgi:hypothetical protein
MAEILPDTVPSDKAVCIADNLVTVMSLRILHKNVCISGVGCCTFKTVSILGNEGDCCGA